MEPPATMSFFSDFDSTPVAVYMTSLYPCGIYQQNDVFSVQLLIICNINVNKNIFSLNCYFVFKIDSIDETTFKALGKKSTNLLGCVFHYT